MCIYNSEFLYFGKNWFFLKNLFKFNFIYMYIYKENFSITF